MSKILIIVALVIGFQIGKYGKVDLSLIEDALNSPQVVSVIEHLSGYLSKENMSEVRDLVLK
ncbi:hypothetical protein [Aliivibrio fischeri]|uniref:hypothetical protein n=1 Tax=Aliivibrio fischeri TaxID=668 RepID=UPI0007C51C8E|nr:hypothetical protein [Aliivibrio fischeri]